ncbi:hypothetical protein [Actinomadura formosensis]|uniref:hypothetical protein n=1 Tax=Actinomadura formosensis TaxID=60706 RepID=UPI000830CB3D|nr:hypothetical protein [Actinomadura formosensis]
MTTGSPNRVGRVDQIVFAWSDRLLIGGSGLGPVATSLDPDGLRRWNDRLVGGDVAVGQWHHGAAECVALGALRLGRRGDHGAVLRLLPARDANGRISQLVHALVGPAAAVDAWLALGLHRWPGWVTPERIPGLPGSLPDLDAGELWKPAAADLEALPVRPEPLAGLLAGVLCAPADRYLADIAPEDLDLVAGLVRRLDGAAGDAPWTMMLGAKVTRQELQPRLLVLDTDDARRGRVPLTTAASGDPRFSRAAALLAALPAASLTPPQRPPRTPAALLDWVEAEHQRATKVLDLIDRALDGTLDDDARRHLDGPSGQERMRAELRHAGVAELAGRLNRWAAGPPPGLGNAGRTLRGIAAERYLAEAGESRDAPEHLADAARRLGITATEASRVLANWFGGLAEVTPTHRYAAVYFALWFEVELTADPTIGEVLRGMPPDDVLRWAAQLAADGQSRAARHFMHAAHDRWRVSRDRAGDEKVRALLLETRTFHETIHRLVTAGDATTEEETELYRIVLHLAYGAPIDDLGPVLSALPVDAAATEFRPWPAVAAVVGQRDLVFQVAAHAYSRNAPQVLLEELLQRFGSADLITGLAGPPGKPGYPGLLMAVCALLDDRRHGIDERPLNREALLANRFLAELVESAWQSAPEHRFNAYELFIGTAYRAGDRGAGAGAGLSVPEVRELLALDGPPLLVAAVLDMAGEDAVLPVLLDGARRRARELGLPDVLADQITRGPHHGVEVEYVTVPNPAPSTSHREPEHASFRDGTRPEEHRVPERDDPFLDDVEESPPADRNALLTLLAGRNLFIGGGITALALALLLSFLIFGGGSDDDPPPKVAPTVTVTTTVTPSKTPATGQNP